MFIARNSNNTLRIGGGAEFALLDKTFYERYADHAVSVSRRVVTIVTGEPYVAVSLEDQAGA